MAEETKPQYSSELFVSEGNLTKEPFDITSGDKEACAFRIACNTRNRHEDEATFFRSVIVQNPSLAEHCLNSLNKGDRVLVYGMVTCNVWEDRDGNVNEQEEIKAISVGAALRWHDVTIHDGGGRSRSRDDDENERPARSRRRNNRRNDDDEERPARSRRGNRDEDAESDDDGEDDDDEERPARSRRSSGRSGRMNRSGGRRGVSRHSDEDDEDDDL